MKINNQNLQTQKTNPSFKLYIFPVTVSRLKWYVAWNETTCNSYDPDLLSYQLPGFSLNYFKDLIC